MATLESLLQAEFGAQFEDWRARLPDLKIPDVAPDGYVHRDTRTITAISIHHAAADPTVRPDAIHRFHQSVNGPNAPLPSPGIAYHIYLFQEQITGKPHRWIVAYVGDITTVRWHTASNNGYTFGICAGGNYEQQAPPWEVVSLLQRCIAVVRAALGGSLVGVWRHRDFPNTSTSCPGKLGDGEIWEAVKQIPVPKPPPSLYNFVLGFKVYADAHPEIGEAIEAEFYGASAGVSISLQRTVNGVLVYDPNRGVRYAKWQ